MRIFRYILILAALGGGYYYWSSGMPEAGSVFSYVDNREILTLEARYTPEEIMEANQRELLGDGQRSYQDAILKFYPYVLLEVKYSVDERKTKEGVILWSLIDGEMVLDTETWEKTHGFEDAINADASITDFKILNVLAKNRGAASMKQLEKDLQLEVGSFNPWIDSTVDKHLVVRRGSQIQLHFQNPKILVLPETKMAHWIVSKPLHHARRVGRRYSQGQIETIAKAAFGKDFKIRSSREVNLPVYLIEVLNPDGSVLSSSWNALTGKKIHPKFLLPRAT